ncbi:DNA-binding protein [Clostridium lacusfryxellense]|uniref:DNA-binding protein n=1 Tax=Clostridium lacusfryxellense TaxID=205328 RepID=UPI001C0BC618|nr:DNA-binding protein [Clostridium lacusfryxellense]MBU3114581.1 DNA-binding protein [Clostridium lacusfryxellense]
MNGYITVQEAAEKWGITTRRVQVLCVEKRILGATKYASIWIIPEKSEKPKDKRLDKKKNYNNY